MFHKKSKNAFEDMEVMIYADSLKREFDELIETLKEIDQEFFQK